MLRFYSFGYPLGMNNGRGLLELGSDIIQLEPRAYLMWYSACTGITLEQWMEQGERLGLRGKEDIMECMKFLVSNGLSALHVSDREFFGVIRNFRVVRQGQLSRFMNGMMIFQMGDDLTAIEDQDAYRSLWSLADSRHTVSELASQISPHTPDRLIGSILPLVEEGLLTLM